MILSSVRRYRPSILHVGLFCLFTILLAGCGTEANTSSTANSRSNGVPQQAAQSADIKPGVQPCPATVQSPNYWSPIVGVQPNVNKVEDVSCANLLGVNELQALVTVRTLGSGGHLDLHVFTHITQAQPAELFKLLSLYKGQTKISPYSTLLTGEVDLNSSVNKGVYSNAN